MTVIRIEPEHAALALPALRDLLPQARATASAQALATYLTVAGRTGYQLLGSFDAYSGTSQPALAVLGFRVQHTLAHGRLLEISELYVLPEARGEGHRAALLKYAQQEAERQGCGAVQLELGLLVMPEDTELYRSMGWELCGKSYGKYLRSA